ncbi:MAG: nickel pincer cofactor biosynthesis protein LarC [Acaryochloridaceae cyanobacterium SU_2_1]|nr:nickel pincer cofactor biosynthesis protein LarC [Acaryochloridaceae cyanobacterium SU_2_1]
MSKLAYFECPTGIAGDMCLGALLDLGVPLTYLQDQLAKLGLTPEFTLQVRSVKRQGQQATYVLVDLDQAAPVSAESVRLPSLSHTMAPDQPLDHPDPSDHHQTDPYQIDHHHQTDSHHQIDPHQAESDHSSDHAQASSHHSQHRHLPEIEQLIQAAKLPERVTRWSLEIFRNLALAEGAVHGIDPLQVHFHEVGATDALVDIVGTCLGLDWLGIDQIYCSPLPTGGGTVKAAHGRLPVPVPAVLKLWEMRQVPIYDNGIHRELVTPTGAAIAITLAHGFGPPPPLILHKIGLGAGSHELSLPNVLRLWLGDPSPITAPIASPCPPSETIYLLETQIDDLNPQALGYTCAALFSAGALDVFTQPVYMKKSRPGTLLSVICEPQVVDNCEALIFRETSTLGIRRSQQQRTRLERTFASVETPWGKIQMKLAWQGEQLLNLQPEYEDCARIAKAHQLPWREVHQTALRAWQQNPQHQSSDQPPLHQ